MPEWVEKHRRGQPVHIPDVLKLPSGQLRDTLEPQGIKTLLTIPMMHEHECFGFVGFDWVKNHHPCAEHEFRVLDLFAQMLANISTRQRAETERNQLQAQLAHSARMESMGRFAGGVAHDFNNMLTVINCHSRLAMNKLDEDDPMRVHLKGIEEAASRSAELTRRLLAFSRKQEAVFQLINLNEHIEDTLSMLRRMIGEQIDLVFRPGSGIRVIKADAGQLDQVLTNLCVNARDAIGEKNGVITIETANATNEHAPEAIRDKNGGCSDYVVITVTDNGCGMDDETRERIFEPFFTTKAAGRGTGLGLATIINIVSKANGFIEVNSRPGTGSSFLVFLPRALH